MALPKLPPLPALRTAARQLSGGLAGYRVVAFRVNDCPGEDCIIGAFRESGELLCLIQSWKHEWRHLRAAIRNDRKELPCLR